jgi:diguanylate cyclase (GGDEF)-like protein/PAS domain S-box-containing protein
VPHIAETVLEAAGIGGWALEISSGHMSWTAITFRICELEPPDAPPLADALLLYPPEARLVVAAAVQAAIDAGTPWDIETAFVTARGRHRWVRSAGLAVRENGRTVRLVGAFQDVTQRHEENARTERLSVVAAQMTNVVITTDRAGRTLWVNAALTRLTGYTLAEMQGQKPGGLLQGPLTDPATVAIMARGIADGTGFDVEVVNYTKAGALYWMAIACSPLRDPDGTVNGFIGVQADVSARRAAEDTARAEATERERAEALLRDVLDTLPSAVTAYDADERFILSNRAYRDMFPMPPGALVPGVTLEETLRRLAAHGHLRDIPPDADGRTAWVAKHLAYFRTTTPRTTRLADGRIIQVRERRSDSGILVTVRTDTSEIHTARDEARRDAAERGRAEALLQDVLDALPNAITAYDSDDRLVMSNRRYAEMFPITARFAVPGRPHAEIIRLAAQHGQYADAPTEPAARDAWVGTLLTYFHAGTTHELSLPGGRVAEVRESRSQTGNRVTVRTDITDLKLAETRANAAAAERSRADALLRDVVNTVPSAILAYDGEERLVLTNPAVGTRTAMPAAFSALGGRLEDVMRLAVAEGYFLDAPATPAEQETWLAQLLTYLRDLAGAPRTMRLNDSRTVQVSARRSDSGNLVIVLTDITEQVRTQALLQDVLEAMPSAVVAYDPDERVVLANETLGEMAPMLSGVADLAMRLADVLRVGADGGYFTDLPTAPAARDAWMAELLTYFRNAGGVPRTLRVSDGHSVQVRARRSATGNLVVVSTDITDLLRAQALLRDVMDALPSAVIAFDRDERIVLANRAHADMAPTGLPFTTAGSGLEDVVRLAAEIGYFADAPTAPAARDSWLRDYLSYLRDSGGLPRTTRLANGRAVQVRTLRSETGNLVIVRTDITDLLAAQALLRDVMDALPSAVIAYDRNERVILTNLALAETAPMLAPVAGLHMLLGDVLRLGAETGYFADAPAAPAEREVWLADLLAYFRDSGGVPRTLRANDDRIVQVRTRRSESGNLVVVRSDITELLSAQAMLRDVLDAIPNSVAAYDAEDRLILFNPAYAQMFPVSAQVAVAGRTYAEIVRHSVNLGTYPEAGDTQDTRDAWMAAQIAHHRTPGDVRVLRMGDGRVMLARERRADNGTLVSVRTDITDLTRTAALLRDILEALPSGVIAYDRDERLVLWNRAAVELLPESAAFAVVGRTLEEMVGFSAASGAYADVGPTEADRDRWIAAKLAAYRASTGSRTLRMRDGRFLNALERRSESGNLVCVRTDTTDLKRAEEHLRWQAQRDPLTELHNRAFFVIALDRALRATADGKAVGGVLLLLDIDYFKQINDTLGHDMGDALLVEIATRLRLSLRAGGEGAARLGGDEFGVVIPGLADPGAAMARMDLLHAALSAPADLGGRRLPIGISMGVTLFPADGADSTKLLKNADLALYEAKRNGRGRWSAFRAEQATALERNVRMSDALREALTRREFTVALQPKRRLCDGAHAGFEALARWYNGTEWVSPGDFIPVAEETGLIRLLGRAILAAALARVREIRDCGFDPGRVAVNITGQQLLDGHFTNETMTALRQHKLGPADLELELTGTLLFGRASERIDTVLRDLSAVGITLALDDFGSGYTSLAHLARLPINRLKIDRAFEDNLGPGEPGGVIVRTVISLAHSLGMEPIAKGVETAEQLAFLAAAGCDVAQGYLISRPLLTTADAVAYLRAVTPSATLGGLGHRA